MAVKKKHLKKWARKLISCMMIFVVLLIVYNVIIKAFFIPVSDTTKITDFSVDTGTSVYAVGEKLKEEGFIRSARAYKIMVKLNHVNSYKAGTYKLSKGYTLNKIIGILSGQYYKENGYVLTFKEGKTMRGVARTIAKNTDILENEVYTKVVNQTYIDTLINKYWFLTNDIKNSNIYYPLEGYLFPETYTFSKSVKINTIIETMLDQTNTVFSKYKSEIQNSSYSVHQLATLASMVEKEGNNLEDRKLIASVFYNRLKSNMPLGSDVTTYYAFKIELGEGTITAAQINTSNPYNTRGPKMNGKLPIGPISNFSEDSLKAVLEPTASSYYYFVADKSGKVHFSKTYEEHLKTIEALKEANNWVS